MQSSSPQIRLNIRYIFAISMVAALGGLLFGYDWVVIGGGKFFYERYFGITDLPGRQAWAMSSALIGCIPGAMFAGYLSERLGRKKSLFLSALLFTLSAVGTGFAGEYASFMTFRIIGGMGIGVASCISPIYIAEVSPKHMRGKFVSLNQLTIVTGILLAQIINYLIAEKVPENATNEQILNSWNGQMGWRWMFWAETIPAFMFFMLAFIIPESPRWLTKMDRSQKALRILQKIGRGSYADEVEKEIQFSLKNIAEKIDAKALLNKDVRPVLITGFVLAVFQQWCGINIVFNYAEEVFTSAGFGISSSLFNIVITGTVNLIFTFIAIRTVDGWGRRKLMLFGSSGLAFTYIILGISYFISSGGYVVLSVIVLAIAIYAMSLGPITWVILSEIFPNRIRGAAMAAATSFLWIASTLLVLFFPFIRKAVNISGAFWIYSAICIAGFIFIKSRLPETKGKSLEEVEKELLGK
ncbi:MAG: sugar porter family MFS transporter [Bacteroidales bacterium]|nr:sugar porter family MFS transporter [Bacteroidales bacterium]